MNKDRIALFVALLALLLAGIDWVKVQKQGQCTAWSLGYGHGQVEPEGCDNE